MKTIAHYQPTDAQPVPQQQPSANLPLSFIAELDIILYGISTLVSQGQLCQLCSLPDFVHPQPTRWWGDM